MLLRYLPYLAMIAAGWIGWWVGRHVGFFTAYILAIFAAAAGLYYGRRLTQRIRGEV